jgi:hypothetical protein
MTPEYEAKPFVMPEKSSYKTLRDEFAMAAMSIKYGTSGASIDLSQMAKNCYQMADAMMEARKK